MKSKYKVYLVTEMDDSIFTEWYTKKELEQYKLEPDEDIDLFECAERMIYKFNRKIILPEDKRYIYKLEKVSVDVIGSFPYYGLGISSKMCEPEFK